jgi:hypothetical protein
MLSVARGAQAPEGRVKVQKPSRKNRRGRFLTINMNNSHEEQTEKSSQRNSPEGRADRAAMSVRPADDLDGTLALLAR